MAQASPQPSLSLIDISVLERTAEDISSAASAAGSDIGEEIRKMIEAERERERERSRSRSTSQASNNSHSQSHIIPSSQQTPDNAILSPTTRPRRISSNRSRATSNSYANSVSDARLGITSPVESVRSVGSWSQSQSMHRARMATMDPSMHSSAAFEPTHEPLQEGRPLDSPLAPSASIRSGASQYSNYSQDNAISRRVSQSSLAFSYSQDHGMSRQASQSSFAQRYDQMASQIEEQLQTIPHTPEPEPEEQYQQQYHQSEQEQRQPRDVEDTPDRPYSTDTYQEAQLAFKDFDGVHFNPDTEEFVAVDEQGNEVRRVSARTSSGSLMDAAQVLRTPRARPMSYGAGTHVSGYGPGPSPQEPGMVYYPAPVPRMLNLPKRLSQLPAASVQAKRRTQLLEEMNHMPKEEPAPFIPKLDFDETEDTPRNRSVSQPEPPTQQPEQRGHPEQRMSVANMSNLPPQLRASIYHELPPIAHDVQVKHQSVVATLDSLLAASATAPVSAFVDHPFAGNVRKSVYGMEKPTHNRQKSSTTLLSTDPNNTKEAKKKRSSSIGNFFRRSSGDLLEGESRRPGSRGSQMLDGMSESGGKKLQKRKSQLSIADALERERTLQELEGQPQSPEEPQSGLVTQAANHVSMEGEEEFQHRESQLSPTETQPTRAYSEGEQIAEDFREQDALSDVSDTDPVFVQPSTLLAELQVRKAQLRNRTKTAAIKYPNGMHSTLLQLDAVEHIEKQKRQKQRIALAWEDPHQRQLDEEVNENDDVPLGVLYPSKDGPKKMGDARDWNRPMGLMEQREMEDTEPLSKRAERLNPGKMVSRRPPPQRRMSSNQMALMSGGLPNNENEEVEDPLQEGETLGQRARRMRDRDALDTAISDVVPKAGDRPVSAFSTDVLSQFGGLNDVKEEGEEAKTTEAGEEVEETLGQRRARLQRERSASGEVTGNQPQARPALRSTNSMANLLSSNPVRAPVAARAWEGQPQGLLQTSAANQARQKAELRGVNMGRSSSMGFGNAMPSPAIGNGQSPTMGTGAFTTGGAEQRKSMGLLGDVRARPANGLFVPTAGAGVGFASPTAGAMGGYGQGMMGQQQMMNPAYHGLAGGHSSMMMPQGGYNFMMGYGGQQQMMGMPMMGYAGAQTQGYPQAYGMGMSGMGMGGMEMPLDPNQRAAIDRWRMGIA